MSSQPPPPPPNSPSLSRTLSSSSSTPIPAPRNIRRPRRKASVMRHEQHRDSNERTNDLPTCPPTDQLMEELSGVLLDKTSDSQKSDKDPYADLREQMDKEPFGPQLPAARNVVARTFNTQLRSPNIRKLRQELRETLTQPQGKLQLQGRESRSDSGLSSSSSQSSGSSSSAVEVTVKGKFSGTYIVSAPVCDDEGDFCLNTIRWLFKLCGLLCRACCDVLQCKYAPYLFALLVLYLSMGLLERWAASMFVAFVGWIWPPTHFVLGTTAGLLWRLADWLLWMDEFWQNMICDMAASYCQRYRILCDRQCYFVDRVVERSDVYIRRRFL